MIFILFFFISRRIDQASLPTITAGSIHVTEMQTAKATHFEPFNRMSFLFLDELIEPSADNPRK